MQRPEHRTSRRERAVRVYTICDESRYLIVKNVPALGCVDELVKLFGLYGPIEEYRLLDEEDCEPFTDVYWIKFSRLCNATFAKRKLDDYKFIGNLLDVSYAPKYETLSDTKDKLEERRRTVLNRIRVNAGIQTQEHRHLPHKHSIPELEDPLLHLGDRSEAEQYQPFSSERSETSENRLSHSFIGPVPKQDAHDVANFQYFPSASMNATVQSVRDKLTKIETTGVPEKPTVIGDEHASKRVTLEEESADGNSSVVKRRRQDSRRRI